MITLIIVGVNIRKDQQKLEDTGILPGIHSFMNNFVNLRSLTLLFDIISSPNLIAV